MSQASYLSSTRPEFTPAVRKGIDTLRSGDRTQARRWLAHAVRQDPSNATAWFWLSRSVEDEQQRQDCLRRFTRLRQTSAPRFQPEPRDRASQDHERKASPAPAPRRPPFLRRRAAIWALLAFAILALTYLAFPGSRDLAAQTESHSTPLHVSGIIQATEVSVASEYGGRIAAILADEGTAVYAGEVVARLDPARLDAQIRAAEAARSVAEAALAQAKAGARGGQIAVAQAELARAEEGRIAAMQAVSDTTMLVQHPQDVQMQIAVIEAQSRAQDRRLAQALALKDAAEIGKNQFEDAMEQLRDAGGPGQHRIKVKIDEGSLGALRDRIPPEYRPLLPEILQDGVYTLGDIELHIHGDRYTLYKWVTVNVNIPFQAHLAPNNWWQAWVGVNMMAAQKESFTSSLNHLYEKRANPQDLLSLLDKAIATLAQAESRVAAAQAQLSALQAGATSEELAALRARVAQAQAVVDALSTQRARLEIEAPIDGIVVDVSVHAGEVAAAGAPLLAIADLSETRLTVYVPETRLGQVKLGQRAYVQVDGFPEREFQGQVTHIADQAEFTPRNVSTREERVNLVFAVEIRLPNQDGRLKPGMPADAAIGAE